MTHTLARTDNYDFIELFIRHGASFDHRCYGVGQSLWYLEGKLPLNTAVESISALFSRSSIFFEKWNPRKPFFELLVGLSMVIEKKQMDSIRVLVLNTKEAELEICHYAKEGNVVELAVLLMTAREEVALLMSQIRDGSTSNGRISIYQYILSKLEALICEEFKPTSYNEQKKLLLEGKEKKAAFTSVLVLLEFFEMEGDTIEAYIRQERVNINIFPTGWTFMADHSTQHEQPQGFDQSLHRTQTQTRSVLHQIADPKLMSFLNQIDLYCSYLRLDQIRSLNQIDLSCSTSQAPEELPKKTVVLCSCCRELGC
ncbi:hypothetical protein LOK49_LG12G02028 [Camellia lanceoleosa]|uniref:Uncharacterized protein n=1 Tax=Camellia lanceoleosa TaxID=1840588 RepID=A0ACC0FTE5_9ERIC|nr:hypothetical protein LOK49_LG12G02028 [Camellia lanceoleosa]